MFDYTSVVSSFSVDNIALAREFYGQTLGLSVIGDTSDDQAMLDITLPGGGQLMLYQKDTHEAASFTVLNFVVDDIDTAIEQLADKGVEMIKYDGFNQDDRGVSRGLSVGRGPDIAWFNDPSGNILAVYQTAPQE